MHYRGTIGNCDHVIGRIERYVRVPSFAKPRAQQYRIHRQNLKSARPRFCLEFISVNEFVLLLSARLPNSIIAHPEEKAQHIISYHIIADTGNVQRNYGVLISRI